MLLRLAIAYATKANLANLLGPVIKVTSYAFVPHPCCFGPVSQGQEAPARFLCPCSHSSTPPPAHNPPAPPQAPARSVVPNNLNLVLSLGVTSRLKFCLAKLLKPFTPRLMHTLPSLVGMATFGIRVCADMQILHPSGCDHFWPARIVLTSKFLTDVAGRSPPPAQLTSCSHHATCTMHDFIMV